ncbi:hypothetical protein SAMN05428988_0174 [Chitinophaga sp. YR573]|uniref:hypothetical protein n=1 Tax=Chitinophaga sp. YR573 TaxID=1881040 RepID=UPI0008B7268E|nr:hypothetical protein [Chitinophaga sp. YR573]SEV89083.1 hypothetical protein SAMN05428988_0174 [Chitinophaga sp. YR573]
MSNEELLTWLKNRGEYIKIDRIAREIEIPGRTLKAWVDGQRPLPDKYARLVSDWVKIFLKN